MKPMLAGKFREEKVKGVLAFRDLTGQIKYDGIRVFIRNGIAYTRSLKPVRAESFQSWVAHNKRYLEGLDGEVTCGDIYAENCYHRTMTFMMSYNKPDEFTLNLFDKWDDDGSHEFRYDAARRVMEYYQSSVDPAIAARLALAPNRQLRTIEDVWEFHNEEVEKGGEGIILRDPHSYYKHGRGSPVQVDCVKMKEGGWVDTEVTCTGYYEEMHNANEATTNALGHTERSGHKENLIGKGTLGGFEVSGRLIDGRSFEGRIGGGPGLTHELRASLWAERETLPGRLIKMSYFNVGIKDKPRFPKFLGFRDPDDLCPPEEAQGDLFD